MFKNNLADFTQQSSSSQWQDQRLFTVEILWEHSTHSRHSTGACIRPIVRAPFVRSAAITVSISASVISVSTARAGWWVVSSSRHVVKFRFRVQRVTQAFKLEEIDCYSLQFFRLLTDWNSISVKGSISIIIGAVIRSISVVAGSISIVCWVAIVIR